MIGFSEQPTAKGMNGEIEKMPHAEKQPGVKQWSKYY